MPQGKAGQLGHSLQRRQANWSKLGTYILSSQTGRRCTQAQAWPSDLPERSTTVDCRARAAPRTSAQNTQVLPLSCSAHPSAGCLGHSLCQHSERQLSSSFPVCQPGTPACLSALPTFGAVLPVPVDHPWRQVPRHATPTLVSFLTFLGQGSRW